MKSRAYLKLAIALALGTPCLAAVAPDSSGEAERWMIEQARAWANQACGGKWVITELFAEDFRGTSPKGTRYDKPANEPVFDEKTVWSTDCRLDEADVRFFGDDVAVMYGAESKTVPLPDGKTERRCLVWTDMWLKRNERWQIIAVQDNRVDCVVK
jgi:hypothetical protein